MTLFVLLAGMLSDNKPFLTMSRQDWFLSWDAAARRKGLQKIQRNLGESYCG